MPNTNATEATKINGPETRDKEAGTEARPKSDGREGLSGSDDQDARPEWDASSGSEGRDERTAGGSEVRHSRGVCGARDDGGAGVAARAFAGSGLSGN
jgi:hypothetical protein